MRYIHGYIRLENAHACFAASGTGVTEPVGGGGNSMFGMAARLAVGVASGLKAESNRLLRQMEEAEAARKMVCECVRLSMPVYACLCLCTCFCVCVHTYVLGLRPKPAFVCYGHVRKSTKFSSLPCSTVAGIHIRAHACTGPCCAAVGARQRGPVCLSAA